LSDPIWVVIPAFNEAPVIADVVADVVGRFSHVVVVDDGSTDTTARRAAAAGAVVVRHPVNLGQGAALQTGIRYALRQKAGLIVTFDADGQHRVEDVARMIDALLESGSDVALGSRFLGDAVALPTLRRVVLKMAVWFTNLTTRLRVSDAHNGLRVLTREAAQSIMIQQNGMAHASEILAEIRRAGLSFVEVPVTILYTEYSRAKGQGLGNAVNILNELLLTRLQR
jgi:glycosyltransferase involved in cell wall biosynthesis